MTSVGSSTTASTSWQQQTTATSGTHRHHGHHGGGKAMQAAADALGLSDDDLQSDLQSGQTLAQIAQQQGVSTSALTSAISSSLQSSDSSLSVDQASSIAQRMVAGPQQQGGDSSTGTAFGQALDAAAGELGMSDDQLRSSLGNGTSLLDLAQQQGVSSTDLTNTLSTALQKADTSLSSDQASAIAQRIAQGPPIAPPPGVAGAYDQNSQLAAQYATTISAAS